MRQTTRAFRHYLVFWLACLALFIARFYIPSDALVHYDKILISLLVFTTGLTVSDILTVMVRDKIGKGPMNLPATTLTENLVRYSVVAVALLTVFSVLGIAVAPLLTALGVGSLAVAFGLQDTISNFFAGIYLLKSQIIKIGDFIRLEGGQEGYVVDVGLRVVSLKTLSNTVVYAPTSKIAQSVFMNFSHPTFDFTTPVEIQIDFDSNLELVEKVTFETAKGVVARLQQETDEAPASVRFHGLADAGIQLSVYLRAKEMDKKLLLVHEFLKELTKRFKENGIKLSVPTRVVHLEGTPRDST